MIQIRQFYLTEFLKGQRYFLPVMILFLQFHHLNYTEILVLYALEASIVFLLEVPSGVFADLYGKKKSLLIARASLIPALTIFALADGFWWFVAAMVFMGINKAFKSGTHKAYIYDYLEQTSSSISYSEVIGKNKFWSKSGEAIAASVGGWLAVSLGYPSVFWVALVPAFINLVNAWCYRTIQENQTQRTSLQSHISHIKQAFQTIYHKPIVFRLILNSAIFISVVQAAEKFLQPYLEAAFIPISWFGPIYTIILLITAIGARYAYYWEKFVSQAAIANISGWLIIPALALLTAGWHHPLFIGSFFLLIFFRTTRRPAMLSLLNQHIEKSQRATILSTDALIRALLGWILLPCLGLAADHWGIYICFGILGGLALIGQWRFRG